MPPVLLLHIYRFTDDRGVEHVVEVAGDVAAILRATEPKLKERLCTDAGVDVNRVGEDRRARGPRGRTGNPWEGPRFSFRWLVGESSIWDGPGRDFCGGGRLPRHAYCLCCDRSGRDGEIPTVDRGDVQRRREYRHGRLKGGRG